MKRRPAMVLVGRCIIVAIALAVALGSAVLPISAQTVERPQLPPGLLPIIERVQEAELTVEDGEIPPQLPPDTTTPAFRLRAEIIELTSILETLPLTDRSRSEALQALTNLQRARNALEGQVDSLTPTHLGDAIGAIGAAERSLGRIKVAFPWLPAVQRELAAIARLIAADVFETAQEAGVGARTLSRVQRSMDLGDSFLANGQYHTAVVHFGLGLKAAVGSLVFDPDLFEQNIRDALENEAVGFAYAINVNGLFQSQGADGFARTSVDDPQTAQSATREMHVASVSKTITTVAVLQLLEEKGLSVNDQIGPWLPNGWSRGAGVNAITFKELLTHTSGFGQNVALAGFTSGNSSLYVNMQTVVGMDLGSKAFDYENANFGIFRVIISKLLGIDPEDYPEFSADVLTSSAYILHATNLLGSNGITANCFKTTPDPTLYYRFPYDNSAGAQFGDYELLCGGLGYYVSATELAQFLATLRFTDDLLSPAARTLMYDNSLGWMDPNNGYPWGNGGAFGVYHNHGGDWSTNPAPNRGVDSCIMDFSITVQASLIINSNGGNYPYQCQVLRDAFDAAWVPSNP